MPHDRSDALAGRGVMKAKGAVVQADENARSATGVFDGLDKIRELQGVTYNWINPVEHTDGEVAGITAQNLEEVFPDWVEEIEPSGADADLIPAGEKAKAIHFPHDFNAYLIESIKELDAENTWLASENADLEKRMETLEDSIRQLQKAVIQSRCYTASIVMSPIFRSMR